MKLTDMMQYEIVQANPEMIPQIAAIEKETFSNGTLVYHTNAEGLRKRYSFTPI